MNRWLTFLLLSFALFFVWEMAQGKLFASMQGLPFWSATALCLKATAGDLFISAIAFGSAAAAAKTLRWPAKDRVIGPMVVFLLVGLAISIAYELRALQTGRWEYDPSMPTLAGVGILPLLQWLVIPMTQAGLVRAMWKQMSESNIGTGTDHRQ